MSVLPESRHFGNHVADPRNLVFMLGGIRDQVRMNRATQIFVLDALHSPGSYPFQRPLLSTTQIVSGTVTSPLLSIAIHPARTLCCLLSAPAVASGQRFELPRGPEIRVPGGT